MVKHVYYKKASDRLYLAFVGEMDRQARNAQRRQKRDVKEKFTRKVLFVADYIQCKYSAIYNEGEELYDSLIKQYPDKHDLRKVPEYIIWKKRTSNITPQSQTTTQDTVTPYSDRLLLEIPLLKHKPKSTTVETPDIEETDEVTVEPEPNNQQITTEAIDEGCILPTIFEEIPSQELDRIINELMLEPELENILDDIDLIGMDIEIDTQSPLEIELSNYGQ